MNDNDINYQERVKNFQIMTDNYNESTAVDYLTKSNWDENVNTYLSKVSCSVIL
jgi:hypothetical protein